MIRSRLAAVVLTAGFVCAPAAVQAQGILDIGRIILGLPTEPKEAIDYRERAPLVVPPGQNLRQPLDAAPAEQRRANWPQDPDVTSRRKAVEDARKPMSVESVTGRDIPSSRRMTPDEIRAGRVAGAEVPRVPATSVGTDRDGIDSAKNVFGGLAALREMDRKDAAAGPASGSLGRAEPKREFLTDPPTGIRRPADNAAYRATREGRVGVRDDPNAYDIFKQGPNTR
jgi:hypothetical protein